MPTHPGQTLSHYRLIEKIGEGGMSEVWKAVDTSLDREVAIKLLPRDFRDDPDRLARFEKEAKVVAALNHPNIVTIHSIEEHDGEHFITMELVHGGTFSDHIPAGGITHRDLKPANVMLADEVDEVDEGMDCLETAFDHGFTHVAWLHQGQQPRRAARTFPGSKL